MLDAPAEWVQAIKEATLTLEPFSRHGERDFGKIIQEEAIAALPDTMITVRVECFVVKLQRRIGGRVVPVRFPLVEITEESTNKR